MMFLLGRETFYLNVVGIVEKCFLMRFEELYIFWRIIHLFCLGFDYSYWKRKRSLHINLAWIFLTNSSTIFISLAVGLEFQICFILPHVILTFVIFPTLTCCLVSQRNWLPTVTIRMTCLLLKWHFVPNFHMSTNLT